MELETKWYQNDWMDDVSTFDRAKCKPPLGVIQFHAISKPELPQPTEILSLQGQIGVVCATTDPGIVVKITADLYEIKLFSVRNKYPELDKILVKCLGHLIISERIHMFWKERIMSKQQMYDNGIFADSKKFSALKELTRETLSNLNIMEPYTLDDHGGNFGQRDNGEYVFYDL